MIYYQKTCILRQIKQGFSGDGKTLSGLIKIEQYGKNLSIEVSIINFAPLIAGEYYCLLTDPFAHTELLPLRGKSFFNVVSSLDISHGFCGVICFIKNEVLPIAYGVNGDKTYDFQKILQDVFPTPQTKLTNEKTKTSNTAISADKNFSSFENEDEYSSTPFQSPRQDFLDKSLENPFEKPLEETFGEAFKKTFEETPQKPLNGSTREETNVKAWEETNVKAWEETSVNAKDKSNDKSSYKSNDKSYYKTSYDDEKLALDNYYRKEENDEYEYLEQSSENAQIESGNQIERGQAGQDIQEDVDAESVLHPFETDADGYYQSVKAEIDELFRTYPKDDTLNGVFSCSEWVRLKGEAGAPEYLVGVIYENCKAKYVCYALPADDRDSPPEEIKDVCTFVPTSVFSDFIGFFVIFQSAASGECIRPESV